MIPDLLQYFLDYFWNFGFFNKYGPVDPVFITKILQKIQGNHGNILEQYNFHTSTFWNSENFKKNHNTVHHVFLNLFVSYVGISGPKQLARGLNNQLQNTMVES